MIDQQRAVIKHKEILTIQKKIKQRKKEIVNNWKNNKITDDVEISNNKLKTVNECASNKIIKV